MKKTLNFSFGLALIFLVASCNTPQEDMNDSESFGFITKLGKDTLAMENVRITDDSVMADIILRSPEVRTASFKMARNDNGFTSMSASWSREGNEVLGEEYVLDGDSLRWTRKRNGESQTGSQAGSGSILPFIDMIHWPFELMTTQLGGDTTDFRVFSGRRGFAFKVWKNTDGSVIIKHPSRGEMDVMVNESGNLVSLNASRTTRAVIVERTDMLDLNMWTEKFMAAESGGKKFGSLSGRGSFEESIQGADISIDFGTPMKRGRDIWGGLVKFGKQWRTGANRATHFNTSMDLAIGDLKVPAGEYTFFSVPEKDKLTLMINTQTGQNGQSYNPELDLGSVLMSFSTIDETIEPFTIDMVEEQDAAVLRLRWDGGQYTVPVRILN